MIKSSFTLFQGHIMDQPILSVISESLMIVTGTDDIAVSVETKATDVEGWDSLANVRLFIELEGRYGIRFSASEIEGLKNVGEITELISSKTA